MIADCDVKISYLKNRIKWYKTGKSSQLQKTAGNSNKDGSNHSPKINETEIPKNNGTKLYKLLTKEVSQKLANIRKNATLLQTETVTLKPISSEPIKSNDSVEFKKNSTKEAKPLPLPAPPVIKPVAKIQSLSVALKPNKNESLKQKPPTMKPLTLIPDQRVV